MSSPFTDAEKLLGDAWDKHVTAEFGAHSAEEAIATMTESPRAYQVAVMVGGDGRDQLYGFYKHHFLSQIPPDMEITPVSRTIGQGRVVDEMVMRFTHTIEMDWILPGVPPTGKRVESALVAVVQLDGGKVAHENIYWDQASVLVQVGLIDPERLPVVGADAARAILDRTIPLNGLLARARAGS